MNAIGNKRAQDGFAALENTAVPAPAVNLPQNESTRESSRGDYNHKGFEKVLKTAFSEKWLPQKGGVDQLKLQQKWELFEMRLKKSKLRVDEDPLKVRTPNSVNFTVDQGLYILCQWIKYFCT